MNDISGGNRDKNCCNTNANGEQLYCDEEGDEVDPWVCARDEWYRSLGPNFLRCGVERKFIDFFRLTSPIQNNALVGFDFEGNR